MISIIPRHAATPYLLEIVQCFGQAFATSVSLELHSLKATKFPALIRVTPEKE